MPDWLTLLRDEVGRSNITQAAKKLGYSRTAVSQALSGTYGAGTSRLSAKVILVLGRVSCPGAGREVSPVECRELRSRPMPTGNRNAFRSWQACRTCPHRPRSSEGDDHVGK
ncbi:MAG: LacI family transcriptional regulator [Alphaproteobacteria bacterium]|nr:LacI family transcriptional regulator [Alphaproteobacteria bacterium]